jgi:hypothetical protein
MKPSELAEYLRVLRDAQLMSAEVVLPELTIRAVFAPEMPGVPLEQADEDPNWGKYSWKGDQ